MNYNIEDLHLESDGGFVLGQSVLGIDRIYDTANSWVDIKGDFTHISLSRSVSVDKGVWFRPETAVLTLRTNDAKYLEGTFGKRIRLRYKDTVLFEGKVKAAKLSPDPFDKKNTMTLTAVDQTEALNNYVQMYFTAPSETAGNRIKRALPDAIVTNCNRILAARAESSLKLMTIIQEAVDAQLARFYINKTNQVVVDATPSTEPTALFTDEKGAGIEYKDLSFEEDTKYVITGCVVEVGDEEDVLLTASNFHPSATFQNEEKYNPVLPLNQTDVNAWAASFPVQSATSLAPVAIRAGWSDAIGDIELLDLIRVRWNGREFDAGVSAIDYDITPFGWDVDLELIPAPLVRTENVLAPSEVRGFAVTGRTDTSISLGWTRPNTMNQMSGYEIRYAVGTVPPASRTAGTLLATLPLDATSYTAQNLTSRTNYAFSIWAITNIPEVYSRRATAATKTNETLPTAVRSLAAAKTTTTTHTITWTAPSTLGDAKEYVVSWSGGSAVVPLGTTTYTRSNLPRNTSYTYTVRARTLDSAYGPSATATQNTNETVPSAVSNFTATKDSASQHTLSWTHAANRSDFDEYVITWTGGSSGSTTATGSSKVITGLVRNKTYTYTIKPKTIGGLYGGAQTASQNTNEVVPTVPRNFTSTAVNYSTINLFWDAPSTAGDMDEYLIRYRSGTTAPSSPTDGTLLGVFPKSQVSTSVYNLSGSTTYTFAIWARTVDNLYSPRATTTRTTPAGIVSKYWEGQATWSRTYKGDGTKRTDSSGDQLYYGYSASFNGNMGSMAGFSVPSDVKNSYAIDKVELTFYNDHTYNNSGATCYLGWHYNSSEPSTFNGYVRKASYNVPKGGTVTLNITTWIRDYLDAGVKGIVWGPAPSTSNAYYGYARGTGSARPTLRIWYRVLNN